MKDYREQVFLRRKDKQPLCVQASRHKPNPEQVFAAGISCAVWGRGTDIEENRQNQRPRKSVVLATQIKQFYHGMLSEIWRKPNELSIGARWVAGQDGTGIGSLDTAESLQLLRLDRNLSTEANLAGSPLDEGYTVGIQ